MITSINDKSLPKIDWVIASHNQGKVKELAVLLQSLGLRFASAAEFGVSEPEETGTSFIANALLKANHVMAATGLPSLADDSGLAVVGLKGDPGIYSARWAGANKDFMAAMQRIEQELAKKTSKDKRRARMVCALALARPNLPPMVFEGEIWGEMVWPPRGGHGFGYDAAFLPDGHQLTFGEMQPDDKHAISHRADAFRQLLAAPELSYLIKPS